jgi:hypothetical protein
MPPFRDGASPDAQVQRLHTLILRSVVQLAECLRLTRQAAALQAMARRQLHRQTWPHDDLGDTGDADSLAELADVGATGDEDMVPSGPAEVTGLVGVIVRGPWPEGVVVRGPWPDSSGS